MQKVFGKWSCCTIAHNSSYIASFGTGVTVLDRYSLEQICHFTGLRSIHGGVFVSDDVLMVYTGEQRLYFLQISSKSIIWECARPRELASCGDMRCCLIPGTEKAAIIARGKKSLNEHYLLLADYQNKSLSISLIPDVYRVTQALTYTPELGLHFLSSQGEEGKLLYMLTSISENGESSCLCRWESREEIVLYTGRHIFACDHSATGLRASLCPVSFEKAEGILSFGAKQCLPLPVFEFKSFGGVKKLLPRIIRSDEERKLFAAVHDSWLGVYDLDKNALLAEYELQYPQCCSVLDGRLFVGCAPGLYVQDEFISGINKKE